MEVKKDFANESVRTETEKGNHVEVRTGWCADQSLGTEGGVPT